MLSNTVWVPFFLSMLPVTELRGAIPWAILVQELSWYEAVFFSIIGNFIISIPVLFFIDPISNFFRNWKLMDNFFLWLFTRTRKKGILIDRFEFWGLVLFVGIPLPVTGAWTGCVAAYLFGLSKRKSFLAIFMGLCMSAAIVTTLTLLGYMVVQ